MRQQYEVDEIALGDAVIRLRSNKDFQKVIEQEFLTKRMIDLSKTFSGSGEEIDMIKSISLLNGFLDGLVESSKMIKDGIK